MPSQIRRSLSAGTHAPLPFWFTSRFSPNFEMRHTSSTVSGCPSGTAKCPESLCPVEVLPPPEWCHCTLGRTLLLRHRSYELMRQTISLLTFSAQLYMSGLCRLLPIPAAKWPFPTLSLQVLPKMLRPLPRRFAGCTCLLLPLQHRPSPSYHWVGIPYYSAKATS